MQCLTHGCLVGQTACPLPVARCKAAPRKLPAFTGCRATGFRAVPIIRCCYQQGHSSASKDATDAPQQVYDKLTNSLSTARQFAVSLARVIGSVAFITAAMFLAKPAPALAAKGSVVPPVAVPIDAELAAAKAILGQEADNLVDAVNSQYIQSMMNGDTGSSSSRKPPMPANFVKRKLDPSKGVPVDFNELMTSQVYDPRGVPQRNTKEDVAELIYSIVNQYETDDQDLGIAQFLQEQKVEQAADTMSKNSKTKNFEQEMSDLVFGQMQKKKDLKPEDIPTDCFKTDVAEELLALFGEASSLNTAWNVRETMLELTYTQFWYLVDEGHVEQVRFYGPEKRAAMVTLRETAPGGWRQVKVVVPPDPDLFDHLMTHGVHCDVGENYATDAQRALAIQIARYMFPFMVISGVFWLLHTWLLDPMPNEFGRKQFLRNRREIQNIVSKLNFRSPARMVNIDTSSTDFIPWDEIHGIDEVKKEITEIIDYLKEPALLRLRGVSRVSGVLLAGAPGTGKTLLARAIAAESGVSMYTCSGTDFYDVYTGVGARKVRETFAILRNNAPAILFIDEFDALGAARSSSAGGGDESANLINELLVQLDGFEDNSGIVLLAATNRPNAIDSALIRPGRFDRIIYMPLPDAMGRAKILQVHARNKAIDPTINWYEVARAMSGFTGADCMGLMQRAARMAGRKGRDMITEDDIYAAMENRAVEQFAESTNPPRMGVEGVPTSIPLGLKKALCVYEAGKALIAYITPDFEEIARVSICPANVVMGYTLFVQDEERDADAIMTKSDMEATMVVDLAGRVAEKLVMGEGNQTSMASPDIYHANMVAREMVLMAGFSRKLGPISALKLVATDVTQGGGSTMGDTQQEPNVYYSTDLSSEQARVAATEISEILEAAEAKATYGLAINWRPLQALVGTLLEYGTLSGAEVAAILEGTGVIHFPNPELTGYGWDSTTGGLVYPELYGGTRPTFVAPPGESPPDSGDDSSPADKEVVVSTEVVEGEGEGGEEVVVKAEVEVVEGEGGEQVIQEAQLEVEESDQAAAEEGDQVTAEEGEEAVQEGEVEGEVEEEGEGEEEEEDVDFPAFPALTSLATRTWYAGTKYDVPRDPDGKLADGWHWNMPYALERDVPEWYIKEMERYAYSDEAEEDEE